MKRKAIDAEKETFTEEEIASLDDGKESERSEALGIIIKHKREAISLEEYCRQQKIDL